MIVKSSNKVILTGVTTAYRLGLNEYREPILANNLKNKFIEQGITAELVLFNDDIDRLSKRHIKLLHKQFPDKDYSSFEGTPVYMVPSPEDSNLSLSEYFLMDYISFLKARGIFFDRVINSSAVRSSEKFRKLVEKILSKKDLIVSELKETFDLDYSEKYISYFDEDGLSTTQKTSVYKFPWAIECVVRWILTGATHEFFAKNYLTKPKGSYYVSSHIYQRVSNDLSIPKAIQFEYVPFDKSLVELMSLLPSEVYINLLLSKPRTNTHICSSVVMDLLKKNVLIGTKRSWFESINFLKYFNPELFSSTSFLDNLQINYFGCYLDNKELNDLILHSKKQFIGTCKDFKLSSSLRKLFLKAILYKNMDLSLSDFKRTMSLEMNYFTSAEFKKLNMELYGAPVGIPISTYLFYLPRQHMLNLLKDDLSLSVEVLQEGVCLDDC